MEREIEAIAASGTKLRLNNAKRIEKSSQMAIIFNLVPRKIKKFIGNITGNYGVWIYDKWLKLEVFVDFIKNYKHNIQ